MYNICHLKISGFTNKHMDKNIKTTQHFKTTYSYDIFYRRKLQK